MKVTKRQRLESFTKWVNNLDAEINLELIEYIKVLKINTNNQCAINSITHVFIDRIISHVCKQLNRSYIERVA